MTPCHGGQMVISLEWLQGKIIQDPDLEKKDHKNQTAILIDEILKEIMRIKNEDVTY